MIKFFEYLEKLPIDFGEIFCTNIYTRPRNCFLEGQGHQNISKLWMDMDKILCAYTYITLENNFLEG